MFRRAFLLASCLLVTACGGGGDAPLPPLPPPAAFDDSNERVWQGRLPCADCAAIDVALRLGRDESGAPWYELQEAYLAADGGDRYVETGQWRFESGVLRLDAEDGGARRFGLEGDGRLSPRDARGRPLYRDGARDLRPVVPAR
jgi:copper homeostasis protein (lipoprotein)